MRGMRLNLQSGIATPSISRSPFARGETSRSGRRSVRHSAGDADEKSPSEAGCLKQTPLKDVSCSPVSARSSRSSRKENIPLDGGSARKRSRKQDDGESGETFPWEHGWSQQLPMYRQFAKLSPGQRLARKTDQEADSYKGSGAANEPPGCNDMVLSTSERNVSSDSATNGAAERASTTELIAISPAASRTASLSQLASPAGTPDTSDSSSGSSARIQRGPDGFAGVEQVWHDAIPVGDEQITRKQRAPSKVRSAGQSTLASFGFGRAARVPSTPSPPSSPPGSPKRVHLGYVPGEAGELGSPARHWLQLMGSSPSDWPSG